MLLLRSPRTVLQMRWIRRKRSSQVRFSDMCRDLHSTRLLCFGPAIFFSLLKRQKMVHLWQAEWCISSSSLFVQFPSHWITASCRTAFQEISGTQRCSFSSKSRKTDGVALCPRRVDKNRINTTRESPMWTCFWTLLPLFFLHWLEVCDLCQMYSSWSLTTLSAHLFWFHENEIDANEEFAQNLLFVQC